MDQIFSNQASQESLETVGYIVCRLSITPAMFREACQALGIVPRLYLNDKPYYASDAGSQALVWLVNNGRLANRIVHATDPTATLHIHAGCEED